MINANATPPSCFDAGGQSHGAGKLSPVAATVCFAGLRACGLSGGTVLASDLGRWWGEGIFTAWRLCQKTWDAESVQPGSRDSSSRPWLRPHEDVRYIVMHKPSSACLGRNLSCLSAIHLSSHPVPGRPDDGLPSFSVCEIPVLFFFFCRCCSLAAASCSLHSPIIHASRPKTSLTQRRAPLATDEPAAAG